MAKAKQGTSGSWMVVLVTLACLAASSWAGEDDNPYVWKPRTTSVAVFKNGLGFIIQEGETELRDGWCISKQVPPAAFGTLAIYSHNENETVDIVGSGPGEVVEFDGRDAPDDDETKRTRLEASRNLNVQLTYRYKGMDRSSAGKLVSVGPEFAVLESGQQSTAVRVAEISRLQVLDLPLRIHVTRDDGTSPERTTLGMAYLRKGLTWIPDYTLDLIDEETTKLTLRGTLVNEAEDLVHCDVHFVVGVPHFVHADYMAPIAVGQVIRTIGAALAPPQVSNQIMSRAAIASNLMVADQFTVVERPVEQGGDLRSALGNLPQMGGAAAADYTVFRKHDLTIRRGEKAIVALLAAEVRYSHLYRWEPPARMEHFLVLHNSTGTAWTTGPCLAISGGRPLSEDLLKYTPAGGDCEFPVTTAVNIAYSKTEEEAARELRAYSPRSNVYRDLITINGEAKLRSFEKRPAEVAVLIRVPGKPTGASDEGALFSDATRLKLTDLAGSARWTVTLKPGDTKLLSYSYERYVPSD